MTVNSIAIPENFDSANAFDYRSALEGSTGSVNIDFAATRFIDSAGIGTLVFWLRAIQQDGGEMVFSNLSGQPYDIVKMVGLDKLVEIRGPVAA